MPVSNASKNGNVVTIPQGYIANETELVVGTAKEAQIITPGTSDIVLPSDTYIAGAQTIKGDANLLAKNIRTGIAVFDVVGEYVGDNTGYVKPAKTLDTNAYHVRYLTYSQGTESYPLSGNIVCYYAGGDYYVFNSVLKSISVPSYSIEGVNVFNSVLKSISVPSYSIEGVTRVSSGTSFCFYIKNESLYCHGLLDDENEYFDVDSYSGIYCYALCKPGILMFFDLNSLIGRVGEAADWTSVFSIAEKKAYALRNNYSVYEINEQDVTFIIDLPGEPSQIHLYNNDLYFLISGKCYRLNNGILTQIGTTSSWTKLVLGFGLENGNLRSLPGGELVGSLFGLTDIGLADKNTLSAIKNNVLYSVNTTGNGSLELIDNTHDWVKIDTLFAFANFLNCINANNSQNCADKNGRFRRCSNTSPK